MGVFKMAELKEYYINYEIKTYTPGRICIMAESEEDAEDQFDSILAHEEEEVYEENEWIDEDVIFDVEWSIDRV